MLDQSDVVDMMQQFQTSIGSKLEMVCNKLDNIDTRMVALESHQKTLEDEIRLVSVTSTATCSTSTTQESGKRKRITPSDLQVRYLSS